MALRYIESDKLKGKKLVYDGYLFHKNREAGTKIYWKCDRYHKFKCRVRVITVNEQIVNLPREHNHAKDVVGVDSANDLFKARQMVESTKDSSPRPVNQPGNGIAAASGPKHQRQMTQSLSRAIMSTHALKQQNAFPALASSKNRNESVFPDKFTKKSSLLYDSGQCEKTRIDDEPRNEKILKAMLYQRSQSQNKSAPKLNVSAALGKPANNERIRKTPLNAASTSSNNSTLSSQPIEIENDSPPAKKPREIHIDIDVSEDESPPKPFIQPAIEPPVQKSMKSTAALPPSSVARNPVLDVNVHQKQKRILVVPNHHQSVMSNLSSLWKAGRLCDAFISNGAVNVKVHKMILGAVCPKVLDVFYNTPQHKLPKVTFPSSVSKEGLLAFAEYMYNGVLDLDPDLLFQMKIIAQRLDMKDFEQLCSNQLKPFMVANTLPTILEPMLSEPCSSSGLLQQMSSQSQSLQTTSRIERISSSKRAYQKGAHVDSLNSISTTADCSTNISLSNLPLVEVRTESDDMLMEVINNDLAPPSISDNIGDVNINERTSIKIEKVEHEQHYGNEFASSSIDYSTSDNINTSNFTHLPHTAISSQSQSSPSTTSKSPHTNNTTVTKPLPADEIWTATSKDQGDLVGNVKSDDPYPIGLFTSNWANVPLHTQDIKKEYTVE